MKSCSAKPGAWLSFALLAVLVVSGCVSKNRLDVPPDMVTVGNTSGVGPEAALSNVEVRSDAEILSTPYPQFYEPITNEAVEKLIRSALDQAQFFGNDEKDPATVTVHVTNSEVDLSPAFGPTPGSVEAYYRVTTASGDVIFDGEIKSAVSDNTFSGNERVQAARRRALFENVKRFIETMRADWPKYARNTRLRREKLAEIEANLQPENASFRVVANGAEIRVLPDAEAETLDQLPINSVVHIIGRLPSGWLQAARDGKPFGWVYEASLKAEGNVSGGSTTGKKPTIYVAYPKGNEKVAEDAIEFIGYVISENRTDRLEVLVNNRRFPVDRLWSEFAVTPKGLRGFPIRWRVPLNPGRNKININVLDQEGFLVNKAIVVERIKIAETPTRASTSLAELPPRLENIEVAQPTTDVNTENFISILGDWVKETAKSDYNKGNAMFDQGRFIRAVYYYRKSVRTEPSGQAWFNLGISEKALGNGTKALEAFASACKLNIPQACNMAS